MCHRQRPLLLVGVLALPPQTSEQSVQLRDGTGAVACVLTERDQQVGDSAVFNTAWIGRYYTTLANTLMHSAIKINSILFLFL